MVVQQARGRGAAEQPWGSGGILIDIYARMTTGRTGRAAGYALTVTTAALAILIFLFFGPGSIYTLIFYIPLILVASRNYRKSTYAAFVVGTLSEKRSVSRA